MEPKEREKSRGEKNQNLLLHMLSLKHLSEILMEMSNKIYMCKAGKYQSWNISEYTDGIQCLGTEWNEWRKEYKQRGVLKTDCGILQILEVEKRKRI